MSIVTNLKNLAFAPPERDREKHLKKVQSQLDSRICRLEREIERGGHISRGRFIRWRPGTRDQKQLNLEHLREARGRIQGKVEALAEDRRTTGRLLAGAQVASTTVGMVVPQTALVTNLITAAVGAYEERRENDGWAELATGGRTREMVTGSGARALNTQTVDGTVDLLRWALPIANHLPRPLVRNAVDQVGSRVARRMSLQGLVASVRSVASSLRNNMESAASSLFHRLFN